MSFFKLSTQVDLLEPLIKSILIDNYNYLFRFNDMLMTSNYLNSLKLFDVNSRNHT